MNRPNNEATEVYFLPAGEKTDMDVGGGWVNRETSKDYYVAVFPAVHGSPEHSVLIPVELVNAAEEAAIEAGDIESVEDAWPGEDADDEAKDDA